MSLLCYYFYVINYVIQKLQLYKNSQTKLLHFDLLPGSNKPQSFVMPNFTYFCLLFSTQFYMHFIFDNEPCNRGRGLKKTTTGDVSLNTLTVGNATGKTIWLPLTINVTKLQRIETDQLLFCCIISHPNLWYKSITRNKLLSSFMVWRSYELS